MSPKPTTQDILTRTEMEQIVCVCLGRLFENDFILLKNDVSERATTHKLAEYLQCLFPNFNVDCEYNRNYESGKYAPKSLFLDKLRAKRAKAIKAGLEEDDLLAFSTYPDIIVHRRERNDHNLLIIEVKKQSSHRRVRHEFDFEKLGGYTAPEGQDGNYYHYSFGVFILLGTGDEYRKPPELTWFVDGKEVSPRPTLDHRRAIEGRTSPDGAESQTFKQAL